MTNSTMTTTMSHLEFLLGGNGPFEAETTILDMLSKHDIRNLMRVSRTLRNYRSLDQRLTNGRRHPHLSRVQCSRCPKMPFDNGTTISFCTIGANRWHDGPGYEDNEAYCQNCIDSTLPLCLSCRENAYFRSNMCDCDIDGMAETEKGSPLCCADCLRPHPFRGLHPVLACDFCGESPARRTPVRTCIRCKKVAAIDSAGTWSNITPWKAMIPVVPFAARGVGFWVHQQQQGKRDWTVSESCAKNRPQPDVRPW